MAKKVTHPKSFRLTPTALARLNAYCELSGLDASEVARAAIAQFIAPALQGVTITQTPHKPHTNPTQQDEDTQPWFKAFWPNVRNKQFPKRVSKTIKDNWAELKGLDPVSLANKYNNYCDAEELAGREFCHPNSWLANGGYENEQREDGSGIEYDYE